MSEFRTLLAAALWIRKVPQNYAEKAVTEIDGHYLQLVEDAERNGCSPEKAHAEAREAMGDVEALAESLMRSYEASMALGNQVSQWTLRVFGALTMLVAITGLWVTWQLLLHVLSIHPWTKPGLPYFIEAFTVMEIISVMLQVLLLWCGVQILRMRASILIPFYVTCGLIILDWLITGMAWLNPVYGRSIAGASGVSSGGTVIFLISLAPLWAPFLVTWAMRRVQAQRPLIRT